jgi:hypothetical protein
MADIPEPPGDATNRHGKEYEDPHYHDDDVVPADDGLPRGARAAAGRNPAGRIPPPRRRFDED